MNTMTNNIKELYKLAKVKKTTVTCDFCELKYYDCTKEACPTDYPPFTAEKQLELIKWLGKRKDFALSCYNQIWEAETDFYWEYYETSSKHEHFDQALAGLILELWDELSSEQREELKGILG